MARVNSGGGWRAVFYVLKMAWKVGLLRFWRAMSSKNACKTCALGMGGQLGGMRNEAGRWPEVCKKSVQAMAADMQGAIQPRFFSSFTAGQLAQLSPRELEASGRLSHPMVLKADAAHYHPIGWDAAFNKIADRLKQTDPEEMFFYFSGRSSNEAGFLLQLMARMLGTNHVNNCSFYCHQASGVGLGTSIGTGTATLNLEDLEECELFFLIGGNPASNHPRLMTILKDLRRRGGRVVVINPIVETGLQRFNVPSDPMSLVFGSAIASDYLQINTRGDIAVLLGIAKVVLAKEAVDHGFLEASTEDAAAYLSLVESTSWQEIEQSSGLGREQIEEVGEAYCRSEKTVFSWCMGITHHEHGVQNVQTIVNTALLRGMIGKPGAGLLPIRGHSNVQGMGTMNVTPALKDDVFRNLQRLGISPPTMEGKDTMACMEAAHRGTMRVAWCLGGNLFGSNPDSDFAKQAFSNIDLVIYLSTTLNTGHFHGTGVETLVLPVLARDEEQEATTQESMFNFVRLSDGGKARVKGLRSESNIISEVAGRIFPESSPIDWRGMSRHRNIRRIIADVIPGFDQLRDIDATKHEFHIPGRLFKKGLFPTASGKAKFYAHKIPEDRRKSDEEFYLLSVRSEGQFNTVVYEEEDLYRNQDRRDVVLMNRDDMQRMGLAPEQRVEVFTDTGCMGPVLVRPFGVSRGSVVMYYPEVNKIISRSLDPMSKTPAFKGQVVRMRAYP